MSFTFLKLPLFRQRFHLFLGVFRLLPAPLCSPAMNKPSSLSQPSFLSLHFNLYPQINPPHTPPTTANKPSLSLPVPPYAPPNPHCYLLSCIYHCLLLSFLSEPPLLHHHQHYRHHRRHCCHLPFTKQLHACLHLWCAHSGWRRPTQSSRGAEGLSTPTQALRHGTRREKRRRRENRWEEDTLAACFITLLLTTPRSSV